MLKKYPDYRIICLDCLTYAGNLSTLAPVMDNPNFRFVKENITDRAAVYKLFEEEHPDMVVNFAAESHVDRSTENMESHVTIRFLQMRFMAIYLLTVLISSLLRKHLYIHQALTVLQKPEPIYSFLHTTELTGFLLQ